MRNLLILPPHNLGGIWSDPPDPTEPDRGKTFRLLAVRGYSYRRLDPFGMPWNVFAKAHPILRAIDPARALRVLLLHRRADVVLCFFESAALVILLLRRLFLFRGRVAVYDVGVGANWHLRNIILRLVVPRADILLPLGNSQVTGLLAMGARPNQIRPVRDVTSTDFYVYAGDQPNGYILAVGDDVSRDYSTLLGASAGLTCQVIIRSGLVTADKATFANVTVVTNRLLTQEYQRLMAGAILVVLPLHPSIHAGGISTLLEAMSSGKAVIVTASQGLADYVKDGETCLVVPHADAPALRKAIDKLLADPLERTRLGANARCFVVENCSPESDAIQFAEVLDRLIGQSAS